MNGSQPPDAFSKTLESKPRASFIHHVQQQQQQHNEEDNGSGGGGSTVNRLSRVFENTHLEKPKPIPPSKPTSLRPSSIIKPRIVEQQRDRKEQVKVEEETIDSTPLAFKDIRARFQQENAIPLNRQV